MSPIDFLLSFFRSFDEGQVFLPAGDHAHKILTRGKPKQVSVSEVAADNVPVCGGDVNYYGVTLLDDGFVLYAAVSSDSVNLEWQAALETK